MSIFIAQTTHLLLGQGGGLPFNPIPLLLIAALFYFMMIRPEQQKQRLRRESLAGIKKNDRVITVGGVYGLVTNVQKDANEVTIKVDEATNTKLRVTLGSIDKILTDESNEEKSGTKS
ncbi:MAG: preprotein translocase subunit YajC [Planctomycetales bacterium]|nr:preprotein translocase subunit YajC [Planctomycetales bacterium]